MASLASEFYEAATIKNHLAFGNHGLIRIKQHAKPESPLLRCFLPKAYFGASKRFAKLPVGKSLILNKLQPTSNDCKESQRVKTTCYS